MRPNRFKTTHQTLLEALAGTAAVAIENARLFQNLEKQTDTLMKTNIKLEREIDHRKKAEAELNKYKQQLENKVERQTVELNRTRKAVADLKGDIKRRHRFGKIIGKSDSMQAVYALIQDRSMHLSEPYAHLFDGLHRYCSHTAETGHSVHRFPV